LTDKHTFRQTNIRSDRQTYVQTDKHTFRQTNIRSGRQTYVQTDEHTFRQTNIRSDRQTYVQTDKHTFRQTNMRSDRQMNRSYMRPDKPKCSTSESYDPKQNAQITEEDNARRRKKLNPPLTIQLLVSFQML
jgi:hypothetical protein